MCIWILWLSKLAEFLQSPFPLPSILLNDNQTAQNTANGTANIDRMRHVDALSKHIGIKYMFITELIDREIIQLEHIASAKNILEGKTLT